MDKHTVIRLLATVGLIYAVVKGHIWFILGMVAGMGFILSIMATKSPLIMWVLKVMDGELYAGEILGWQHAPKKEKRKDYIEIKN